MEKAEEFVRSMTETMRGKVNLMVGRAIISVVNDSGPIQTMQVQLLSDEVQDDVERLQEYGFTSVPHKEAEGVVVAVGGNRDHSLVVAVEDRRYRLAGLKGGEVAIYDDLNQSVHLTRSGIVIKGGGLPMLLTDTPEITMDSKVRITRGLQVDESIKASIDITAGGEISDQGGDKSMSGMRDVFNSHTHPETNSVTEPPNQEM